VPAEGSLDIDGLDITPEALQELLSVDPEALKSELTQVREHLARFGDRLPKPIRRHFEELESKLG
jgi:phosphoenolpyruvate carboxykinase (GTP)